MYVYMTEAETRMLSGRLSARSQNAWGHATTSASVANKWPVHAVQEIADAEAPWPVWNSRHPGALWTCCWIFLDRVAFFSLALSLESGKGSKS